MPKADQTDNIEVQNLISGRRAMLAGSGALLAGLSAAMAAAATSAGAAWAGEPDGDLIRDCESYCAAARAINEFYESGGDHADCAGLAELEARICEAQATSLAGHAARARAILAIEGEDVEEFEEQMDGLGYGMLSALVRDLVEAA